MCERMLCIQCVNLLQVMVGVVSEQLVSTRVMPALITLASDPDM